MQLALSYRLLGVTASIEFRLTGSSHYDNGSKHIPPAGRVKIKSDCLDEKYGASMPPGTRLYQL